MTLIPHVWVQPTGFGPDVYAGQVFTSDGRPATYHWHAIDDRSFTSLIPVRVSPKTDAGLNQLAGLLRVDVARIERGAA